MSPDAPFGVGLRLGARRPGSSPIRAALDALCDVPRPRTASTSSPSTASRTAPSTARAVKESVYRPDWLEAERVCLHERAGADPVAAACPTSGAGGQRQHGAGSLPHVGARGRPTWRRWPAIWRCHVATLHRLREATGRTITLALEPEPACISRPPPRRWRSSRSALLGAVAACGDGAAHGVRRPARGCCAVTSASASTPATRRWSSRSRRDGRRAGGARRHRASPRCSSSAGLRIPRLDAALRAPRWRLRRGRLSASGGGATRRRRSPRFVDLPEALAGARSPMPSGSGASTSTCRSSSAMLGAFANTQGVPGAISWRWSPPSRSRRTSRSRPTPGTCLPPALPRRPTWSTAIARELAWVTGAPDRDDALASHLRLGRVSNLPTVWTNVLAGVALAGGVLGVGTTRSRLGIALSLFYVGGMYLNDAFDRAIDARERPDAADPGGPVSARTVSSPPASACSSLACWRCLGGGRRGAPGRRCCRPRAWASPSSLYDAWHKGNPLGPVLMGAVPRARLRHRGGRCRDGRGARARWSSARCLVALPDRADVRRQARDAYGRRARSGRWRSSPRPRS